MLFVLCGPGGVGKGTVATALLGCTPKLRLSQSWTTRSIRSGESQDAYVFANDFQFKEKIEEGFFVEWASFLGNLYGTPWPHSDVLGCDSHLLLEIDVQGARQIRDRFSDAVIIILVPPSDTELQRRLEKRGDGASHVQARLGLAISEIMAARALGGEEFVNETLAATVDAVSKYMSLKIQACI